MIGRFRPPEAVEPEEPRSFDDFELRLGDVMRGERATMGKSLLDVQRDLKIKASYIAAIENADPSAIETPGFVAGYVRSYARYLGLDPEWAFQAFCAESGFETPSRMTQAARRSDQRAPSPDVDRSDIFANAAINFSPKSEAFLSRIEPGAIGSTAVLLALIGLIGYGGFAVLKEVQKVEVVPVDQTPSLSATLDPLTDAVAPPPETDELAGVIPKDPEGLDRIYRPQALDVPVLVARDGPIAALDPAAVGVLAPGSLTTLAEAPVAQPQEVPLSSGPDTAAPLVLSASAQVQAATPRVVADGPPELTLVAVRESWVRVRSADGTNIYEKVMQPGDTFTLPQTESPANLRTGNAGGVYFLVDGQLFGPAGSGGSVVNVASLAPGDVTSGFEVADLARDQALCEVMIAAVSEPDPSLLACRN